MKIESVESFVSGSTHVVRIRDSDGCVGIGQSGSWSVPQAAHAVVESYARPALLGAEADRVVHLHGVLSRMAWLQSSVISAAVSAIDMALWDLKARRAALPLFELLGGRVRDRVRLHVVLPRYRDLVELESMIHRAVDDGFTAVKIREPSADTADLPAAVRIRRTAAAVEAARTAGGDGLDLLLELHRSVTPALAPSLLAALADHHLLFAEDPIPDSSIRDQARLSRSTLVPLALGEHLFRQRSSGNCWRRGGCRLSDQTSGSLAV